ncbi:hypothetical protein AKJ37_02740 [candidate division MSBL1 archaeon SCGC-AAA259I09]|uniref:Uncharacterized protein n=2 Tax=candidate division MSBL1 TaxID=215777 RepID=A0A133UTU1_9EURY|nr:hypothetical protein AKJ37_02740 [candidate division MSBL1 archaeon SCGC-AAA259I09]KXA98492.1 hypothetical protein AKJ39_01895 [candidate division MSBL1 archaeon SCGC-AAA259J03]
MGRETDERLSVSKFRDTILRTLFIMVVAVVFTRLLGFPLWVTIAVVIGGIVVIVHALIWIRRLEGEESGEKVPGEE